MDFSLPILGFPCRWQVHAIMPSDWLRWGLPNIFTGWLQTVILLISASQVARIIGISHLHRLFWFLFDFVMLAFEE
jgi:hypothetical protein